MPQQEVSFMKKALFVVVLALALTFALAMGASATTGKFFKGGVDYYTWTNPTGSPSPGTAWVASGTKNIGSNPALPGVHANYLATTAKCGICHSVHRADAAGVKLLPSADVTCAGCHTQGTTITTKVITWADVNLDWVPAFTGDEDTAAGGGGGPHNDPVWDTVLPDLADPITGEWPTEYPAPSYDLEPFSRYGCFTRRCHITNPHGANSSKYPIFAAKLLFNNTPAQDDAEYEFLVTENGPGTYGGLDAAYDDLGATDAAVQRFLDANVGVMSADVDGNLFITHEGTTTPSALDANETHALVAGLTCGRPCNPATGEDECHAEAAYAIVDKGISEMRNHGTGITGNDGTGPAPLVDGSLNKNAYRTDNTGSEYNAAGVWYSGGNGNRDDKTGHVAGTFAAVNDAGSYVAIAGCTSCHDQIDMDNTVYGNFTFPHGQTPTGVTNALAVGGGTGTGVRSRIWSGWAGYAGATKTVTDATTKAYDGQCLKCHRDTTNTEGIGLTK
jgi:hypothetical protein